MTALDVRVAAVRTEAEGVMLEGADETLRPASA
jgi:hypothetical protein